MKLNAGFDISYDGKLISRKAKIPKPEVRTLDSMKKVLLNPDIKKPKRVYLMYRNVYLKKDLKLFRKHNIRYDITIIPPNKLGLEWAKTKGHYHPKIKGLSYMELYEILHGSAHCLLQKEKRGKIVDAVVVKAKKGDKVIIPPNYGHVTINASNEFLIMANLVSSGFSSKYKDIIKKCGGAYYGLVSGKGIKFVRNYHYREVPKLRMEKARFYPRLGVFKNTPIYRSFIKYPERFKFLNDPRCYK